MSSGANVKVAIKGCFSGGRRSKTYHTENWNIIKDLKRRMFNAENPTGNLKVKCFRCGKRHNKQAAKIKCIKLAMSEVEQ